jgi:hypothetical protein
MSQANNDSKKEGKKPHRVSFKLAGSDKDSQNEERYHCFGVNTLAITPDYLFTGGRDSTIKQWKTVQLQIYFLFNSCAEGGFRL